MEAGESVNQWNCRLIPQMSFHAVLRLQANQNLSAMKQCQYLAECSIGIVRHTVFASYNSYTSPNLPCKELATCCRRLFRVSPLQRHEVLHIRIKCSCESCNNSCSIRAATCPDARLFQSLHAAIAEASPQLSPAARPEASPVLRSQATPSFLKCDVKTSPPGL
eukprot:6290060-Amphidinium_carterae.1